MASTGRMTFLKYGRSYQLRIEDADDLVHLLHLDESHWMATSAPVAAFTCDPVFLEFVDADRNGRIRSGEVRGAVAWLLHVLADRDRLGSKDGTLRLDDINVSHDEGRKLRSAAERILNNLGKPDENRLSLSEVRDTQRILGAADANGDGIIPPSAGKNSEVVEFLEDILATVGGETDAGGRSGVTEASLSRFLSEAASYLVWHERGDDAESKKDSQLMPLGTDTPAAFRAFAAIRTKVDEYFRLCATVSFDPTTAESFRLDLKGDYAEGEVLERELQAAPVAPVAAVGKLNLEGPVNPFYEEALESLARNVLAPVLGKDIAVLSEEQWRSVCAALEAHAAWQATRPDTKVASLGIEKLRQYQQSRFKEAAQKLIEVDKAAADEINIISQVEKLILYQQWLLEFVNNFVSFPRLYDPTVRALFEAGTLVMDGRQFTLCVNVANRAEHAKVAKNSRLCVLYVELTQSATGKRREIAAAVTNHGLGNLYTGKHGIFVDRDDRLWDARVMQIVENPISLSQALLLPFRRLGQLIQSQVDRFAGSGQKILETKVSQRAAGVATAVQTAAQKPPGAAPVAGAPSSHGARDLLMGGGVAVAALGSAFAFIVKQIQDVNLLSAVPKVLCLLLLVVLVPTIINAWVKLRLRDLGSLLEACGWAINGRMRLTRVMQGVFTRRPRLPERSVKDRSDRLRKYTGYAASPFLRIGGRILTLGKDAWEGL